MNDDIRAPRGGTQIDPPMGHRHSWFISQTKAAFEPDGGVNDAGQRTYVMYEYAYLMCKCGTAVKTLVEDL